MRKRIRIGFVCLWKLLLHRPYCEHVQMLTKRAMAGSLRRRSSLKKSKLISALTRVTTLRMTYSIAALSCACMNFLCTFIAIQCLSGCSEQRSGFLFAERTWRKQTHACMQLLRPATLNEISFHNAFEQWKMSCAVRSISLRCACPLPLSCIHEPVLAAHASQR